MDFQKLKFPIRIISSILSILLFAHIALSYIYAGGEKIGEIGGSISIGVISEGPGELIHPLEYGEDVHTDMMLRFMFRSLIRTNADGNGYLGDIARCDLTNLAEVSCTIQDKSLWSDGSNIRGEDVIKTIEAFAEASPNARIGIFAKTLTVTASGNTLFIKSGGEANPLMLDLLTYPIVRSDMIELIKTNRLNTENYITSGPYTLGAIEKDATFGFGKVTLEREPTNGKNAWIERYIFKFFTDKGQLERNKDTLHVILPYTEEERSTGENPRFADFDFKTYEYIGLFFQSKRVSIAERQVLSVGIAQSLSGQIKNDIEPIQNIFFTSEPMYPEKITTPLTSIMREKGYVKRDEIIRNISSLPLLLTGSSVVYGKNTFIQSPSTEKIFFASGSEESIVLSGNVPSNVEGVEINGYRLQEYRSGNNSFIYRVAPERLNLLEGKNEYSITFVYADGRKSTPESIVVYYIKDATERGRIKEEVDTSYLSILNSTEAVAKRQEEIQKKRTEVEKLDPRYFYDKDYAPYTLKFLIMNEPRENETIASLIEKNLTSLGIKVETEIINQKILSTMLEKGEKEYDMILLGFDVSGKRTQLSQIFDSTRSAKGINFSKIENKDLDSLFARYRLAVDVDSYTAIEKDILTLLRRESVLLPIGTPKRFFSIDRNLRGVSVPPILSDARQLSTILGNARIKEVFLMNLEGKGFSDFVNWSFGNKP